MKLINTNEYLDNLMMVAKKYEYPLECIDIVPSIMDWCEEHDVEETNPCRARKCLKNRESGKFRILLAEEITPEMQSSVIRLMKMRDYGAEVEELQNYKIFLLHLLLHELAHAKNDKWTETECDNWAFGELAKIAI